MNLSEKFIRKAVMILFFVTPLTTAKIFSQSTASNFSESPIKYSLFNSQSSIDLVFYNKGYKSTKLTKDQLLIALSTIKKVSDSLDLFVISTNTSTGTVDTLRHVFQIVTAKNNKGQIFLWINAICDPNKDWQRRLIFVEDGGSCYYKFKIELSSKRYFDIDINSDG